VERGGGGGNSATRAIKATIFRFVAFSVGEEELAGIDPSRWSAISPPGLLCASKTREREVPSRTGRPTPSNPSAPPDPMEAHVIDSKWGVKAVERLKSNDADR